jgi:hypothetical protein
MKRLKPKEIKIKNQRKIMKNKKKIKERIYKEFD